MVNAAIAVHGAQKPARPDRGGGHSGDRDILSAREAQFRYVWDWYAKTGLDYGDRKNGNATRRFQRQWACWMHISMGGALCIYKRIVPGTSPETGCDAFLSAIDL